MANGSFAHRLWQPMCDCYNRVHPLVKKWGWIGAVASFAVLPIIYVIFQISLPYESIIQWDWMGVSGSILLAPTLILSRHIGRLFQELIALTVRNSTANDQASLRVFLLSRMTTLSRRWRIGGAAVVVALEILALDHYAIAGGLSPWPSHLGVWYLYALSEARLQEHNSG
jgi:hypothetical protein